MKKIITLSHVTAGYEGIPAIVDATITVYERDFIGVIGPNGGGKTTLIKVILNLLKPFSGKMLFFNNFSSDLIGYLPQFNRSERTFPVTVEQVVHSGLMSATFGKGFVVKKEKIKVQEILETITIKHLAEKTIDSLSGGEFQKVMLCRAIISNPQLLILDEPNTFVDYNFETEMYQILKELNKKMAIIMVSHDLGNISSLVKSIACVNRNLIYHHENKIDEEMMQVYNCPIELVTHGHVPHRVLQEHDDL